MVNSCGHGLCENCVNLLFIKGSGTCPTCEVNLRRANFRYQLFQDSFVEKEVDIRKKILKDFNKREEDFSTFREYNDYLEEVEEIIYNLANDIDVEATKKRMEAYKKENAESIAKNRGKKSKDEQEIEDLLEEEKERAAFRKSHGFLQETEEEKLARERHRLKEVLVDELMYSERPADQIVASHTVLSRRELEATSKSLHEQEEREKQLLMALKQQRQQGKFSTGIEYGRASEIFTSSTGLPADESYTYNMEILDLRGPPCPLLDDLESEGYLLHIRATDGAESAGGFASKYPCFRAMQEAFCGLYFSPEGETE
jgi:CDK-activating kinase assembly factor MAT1